MTWPGYLANRASRGPPVANTNTYGVARDPIAATDVPASPMITKENSPRAISAVPARS
jgi:hypothetical protein